MPNSSGDSRAGGVLPVLALFPTPLRFLCIIILLFWVYTLHWRRPLSPRKVVTSSKREQRRKNGEINKYLCRRLQQVPAHLTSFWNQDFIWYVLIYYCELIHFFQVQQFQFWIHGPIEKRGNNVRVMMVKGCDNHLIF